MLNAQSDIFGLDWQQIFTLTLSIFLVHSLSLAIYRLYFHPLFRIPGHKLAAASLWYEFYYDVVLQGQWTFRIREMHERYGPIVRINPHEVHIKDPEFYNEIYAGGRKKNKYPWWCNMAGAPGSMFATADHELHRRRRAPLDGFFSMQAVRDLAPLITAKVNKLVDRLDKASQDHSVVRMDCAFMAVTMDVICSYCFGSDRAYLDHEDFGPQWKETINGAWQKGGLLRAFPWIGGLMPWIPRRLANFLDPNLGHFLTWQDSVEHAVRPILERRDEEMASRTIFHTLRDSDLPAEEKTLRRLCEEGQIFTGAGSETTARTLSIILYYLVTTPGCMARLKKELRSGRPTTQPSQHTHPYLAAVISEGLRIMHGITTRLPRVSSEPLRYKHWIIPAGTPISSTPYFVLSDPDIFPQPERFRPERWLDADASLEQYLVAFGKGNRACIGINLAYAEMFLVVAAVFRRFSFELFETGTEDVEMAHDFFVAAPKQPVKGIRVKVLSDT